MFAIEYSGQLPPTHPRLQLPHEPCSIGQQILHVGNFNDSGARSRAFAHMHSKMRRMRTSRMQPDAHQHRRNASGQLESQHRIDPNKLIHTTIVRDSAEETQLAIVRDSAEETQLAPLESIKNRLKANRDPDQIRP